MKKDSEILCFPMLKWKKSTEKLGRIINSKDNYNINIYVQVLNTITNYIKKKFKENYIYILSTVYKIW